VAEASQFLQLRIAGAHFLLPSVASHTIEQREGLLVNQQAEGPVAAWRAVRTGRWPAYCLDAGLRTVRRDNWQRAVFLEASPGAVGVIVEDVHLLPRGDVQVTPFTPLGPPATRLGHLFSGAWVNGRRVTLVFEPGALIGYLQSLGDRA